MYNTRKFHKHEPIKDIPKLKKVTHRKRTTAKYGSIIAVALLIVFLGFYGTSKFYDTYKIIFRKPLIFEIRTPIQIAKRLVYKDLPKAQYIDVNPLTSPQQIADTIKNKGSFDYVESEPIATIDRETIKNLIHNKVVQKWGEAYWQDVDYIITNESNYDPYIVNKESGACGLFQALPCTKLPSLDITDQIQWGMNYLQQRYNGPKEAYDFKKKNGWY